jgi:hypothetical protein
MTHKFGISVPKTIEEALAINEETGTDFWRKAQSKEMAKVKVAWKIADGAKWEGIIDDRFPRDSMSCDIFHSEGKICCRRT